MSLVPSPFSRLASATVSGLVSTVAQTFAGVKTFTSALVASAGVQLASLWNTNGTGATDVCVKVGTSTADGSVNASAKLLSVRTGIGGTEVEKMWVESPGTGPVLRLASGVNSWGLESATAGSHLWWKFNGTNYLVLLNGGALRSGYGLEVNPAFGGTMAFQVGSSGRVDQSGTDSTGTPGAATINKPTGKSAIASAATSVVITNSLCAAASRVMVTWHGDHGAARWWVTPAAGSFTVTLSAAASANTSFSWEVSNLL